MNGLGSGGIECQPQVATPAHQLPPTLPYRSPSEEGSVTTPRRKFIAKAGGAMATVAAAALGAAPNVIAQPKVQWRMSTAYPPATDVLQGSAQ